MTAEATYQFLKPSLEQLSQEQKDELCRLISGEPKETKRREHDPVPSVEFYKKKLKKTFFKSKQY